MHAYGVHTRFERGGGQLVLTILIIFINYISVVKKYVIGDGNSTCVPIAFNKTIYV